jgi:protein-disulfide isomerase
VIAPRAASWLVSVALLGAVACEREAAEQAPPPATTTSTTLPTTANAKDLENAPASTPPLADVVAPATAPLVGMQGMPNASPAAGRADAPVRVYVFTDFQCPVCRRAVEPLKLLVRTHPDDVLLVVKHAASERHGQAAAAAAASLAAFRQQRFWAFQDRLFVDQARLGRDDLLAVAASTGLDVAAFGHDLADESVTAQVAYESALATAFDLDATPTFVVNGQVQRGWGSYRGLEGIVERELVRARAIAAEGVPANRVAFEATRRAGPEGEKLAVALFEPLG